ncbi:MAG: tol-pal system protein YbgF [Candidatus Aminicenantes bacterium]|nr:tol-pal system protein YbgF [Candidatus Aminicenantes bacterium]MBL7082827.1 tol-pal system protein YbgF [Candidatus Aminicenantes bacterium]
MSKRLFGILLILSLAFISTGTDKKKKAYELIYQDVQLLRKQFDKLSKKIEKNTEDINLIKEQSKELLNLVKLFQTEQASFKEDQKKVPIQYQIILEKFDALNQQLEKLTEDLTEINRPSSPPDEQVIGKSEGEEESLEQQKPPPDKGTKEEKIEEKPSTPPPANPSPSKVFEMAHSDYRNGNFELAVDGFKMYREQFPESPLVDDSLYWIGECFFSQKNYEKSIEQFNELILNYPRGDKIPAAYLKKGLCLVELGKKDEALSVFKLLISKFPLEEETKIAQQKIKELRTEK